MITRVGDDGLGRRVTEAMTGWGMDLTGVQVDPEKPTGSVSVTLVDGQPSYVINPNQAYDFINWAEADQRLRRCESPMAVLIHGSLALRESVSRQTLFGMRVKRKPRLFVDINLRDPWHNPDDVRQMLDGAHDVKLNDHELAYLQGCDIDDEEELLEAARALLERHGNQRIVLTRGEAGAMIISVKEAAQARAAAVDVADTVGAGDAFSSVCVIGRILGWPDAVTVQRAVDFAADICIQRGATAPDTALYARHLEQWGHNNPQ
ncbi:putative PfkB domain-containing protein [Magnetofaba australis IT-1]|uniref:Putative PfkB domain-containing protein n=2 Tax=Magnetofaba TaxID=1472292 RepID=A0A1Y2K4F8_9PROT|nr:putative PfkB domain-containing protein [Magnetofaba australis IT-1]